MDSAELAFHLNGETVARLRIFTQRSGDLIVLPTEVAVSQGQEQVQLVEDGTYEYVFDDTSHRLSAPGPVSFVFEHKAPDLAHAGILKPGSAVGLLPLRVTDPSGAILGTSAIEVRSRKLTYEGEFRAMLDDIAEQCVDLALDSGSAADLRAIPDPATTAEGLYQQFAFVRALVRSSGFAHAILRVVANPVVLAHSVDEFQSLHRPFRPSASTLSQMSRSSRRVPVPPDHPLSERVASLPSHISVRRSILSTDNPENRFVKFMLRSLMNFLARVEEKLPLISDKVRSRFAVEISALRAELNTLLDLELFRNLGDLGRLPLDSTILQMREGYRELYAFWFRFMLAARIVWHSSEDAYSAGQRDIASLYEYWAFFRLLGCLTRLCSWDEPPRVLDRTPDGFGVQLRRGHDLSIYGVSSIGAEECRVRFDYNRSFGPSVDPWAPGSWTRRMRPDNTVTLWPSGISEDEAESTGRVVHVHFDAKYRVDLLKDLFGSEDDSADDEESASSRLADRGTTYKRSDLLKMHAYRDAIRRSYGAYILYPGDTGQQWCAYQELLPGLGAFSLRPGSGESELEQFLRELIAHVALTKSPRSRLARLESSVYHRVYRSFRREDFNSSGSSADGE